MELEDLYEAVLQGSDIRAFLDELVARTATDLTGEAVLCGITLLRPKRAVTVACSEARVRDLDERQYGAGEGPCLTSAESGQVEYIRDVRSERRWPAYIGAISSTATRSVLAVPFPLEGESSAALNLYADVPEAFDDAAVESARFHAVSTSRALRLALRIASLTDARDDLAAALMGRTSIDIAVGIIMGENRCDQDAAVEIMRRASNARQMKLRDVAAAVIATVSTAGTRTHFEP